MNVITQDDEFCLLWDTCGFDQVGSGIYTHSQNLLSNLIKFGIEPILFAKPQIAENFSYLKSKIVNKPPFFPDTKLTWSLQTGRALQEFLLHESALLKKKKKIIYHGMANINLPFFSFPKNLKFIITIHDIIPLLVRNQVSFSYQVQFRTLLPRVLELASAVVCVSEWTKQTLVEKFPHVLDKVIVIANGYQTRRLVPILTNNLSHDVQELLDQSKGSKYTLLCVSRYEQYKRFDLILDFLKKYKSQFLVIVLTDKRGQKYLNHRGLEYIQKKELMILNNISQPALDQLYQNCDLLIHPSQYEGFCLPAVEALSHAKPVVFCRGTALDETVGTNCGVSVEPGGTVEKWYLAIQEALELKKSPIFFQNIERFIIERPSWEDSAIKLKELYNRI